MNIDYAKRRRIMQRSIKLGHCICDPKKPCPCEAFKKNGICACAGERPDPIRMDDVKLTQMVHNAGCASKISPSDLEAVLGRLPEVDDPAVLCGMPAGDDAGIYQLPDGTCLVQTIDVMTPCVDDPETFGRICAANCVSDIYAMGGDPKTAVSVLAFPAETHDGQIMYYMMKGAMDVLAEAGVALIGGHSIKDEEIKLGFAITGTIAPEKVARHDTAKVGDVLVLTKKLGAGALNFAHQIGRNDGDRHEVAASMATLNKGAAEAMNEVGANACTDVTGFGLFGHLISMLRSSEVTAQIYADLLPAFDGSLDALGDGVIPGAVERNTEYVAEDISRSDAVSDARFALGFDAQTSGGLLIGVSEDKLPLLKNALDARDVPCWVIGKIVEPSTGKIVVTTSDESADAAPLQEIVDAPGPGRRASRSNPAAATGQVSPTTQSSSHADTTDNNETVDGASATALSAFGLLMKSTGAAGCIDEKTKELINFALVVAGRCEPCFSAHYKKAKAMGITEEQLDEAAWCAVAMGGAVVRLFYLEMLHKTKAKTSAPTLDQGDDESCC